MNRNVVNNEFTIIIVNCILMQNTHTHMHVYTLVYAYVHMSICNINSTVVYLNVRY